MMNISEILRGSGVKGIKDFKIIPDTTRKLVIEFTTGEGIFFFKTYENNNEKNILSYIINTGLTEIIRKNDFFFIERKIGYKKIDDLIGKDIGSILAGGYNRLHESMIVYNDCIDEHWFYDEDKNIIKITDFGSAKLKKDTDDDIYIACLYLSSKFSKDEFKKNWDSFKKNYKLKEELKKFEDKYLNKFLIINNP